MPNTICLFPSGGLRRIIVLGLGRQVLTVAAFCRRRGVALEVFAGERQADMALPDGRLIRDELAAQGVAIRVANALQGLPTGPYSTADPGSLLFSFGSPYIIRQDLLDLYNGRAVNSHGAPLPEWRGGGGFSWRILAGDTRGVVLFHLISAGIDEGDILYRREYQFPSHARLPRDWEDVAAGHEEQGVVQFLDGIWEGREFVRQAQDESQATYFPRLHTPSQAYLDWSWTGDALERFIRAFSHPYSGAMTQLAGETVHILDASFDPKEAFPHPFFHGLVYRIHDNAIRVAVADGALSIRVSDIQAPRPVQPGDRFCTPAHLLEHALAVRPFYTPTGLRE